MHHAVAFNSTSTVLHTKCICVVLPFGCDFNVIMRQLWHMWCRCIMLCKEPCCQADSIILFYLVDGYFSPTFLFLLLYQHLAWLGPEINVRKRECRAGCLGGPHTLAVQCRAHRMAVFLIRPAVAILAKPILMQKDQSLPRVAYVQEQGTCLAFATTQKKRTSIAATWTMLPGVLELSTFKAITLCSMLKVKFNVPNWFMNWFSVAKLVCKPLWILISRTEPERSWLCWSWSQT